MTLGGFVITSFFFSRGLLRVLLRVSHLFVSSLNCSVSGVSPPAFLGLCSRLIQLRCLRPRIPLASVAVREERLEGQVQVIDFGFCCVLAIARRFSSDQRCSVDSSARAGAHDPVFCSDQMLIGGVALAEPHSRFAPFNQLRNGIS